MLRRDFLSGALSGVAGAVLAAPAVWAQRRIPELADFQVTRWGSDPFSLGAYSHLAKGSGQHHRDWLAEPIASRLYFAGEATSRDHASTVHGAFLSGRRAANQVLAAKHKRIAVVGAGFSGLSCAHALESAGLDVTLIDARSRLGGRVNTNRDFGVPVELGASWIHGTDGNPLTSIAQDRRMQIAPTPESYDVRFEGSSDTTERSYTDQLQKVIEFNTSFGVERNKLARGAVWAGEEFAGGDALLPDGYDSMIPWFGEGGRVQLSQRVQQIAYDGDGVKLNGQTRYDAVVVTASLGVLKAGSIKFTPGLPSQHREAIAKLGMGLINKVYLKFSEPFWDPSKFWIINGHFDQGRMAVFLDYSQLVGQPILMAFNAADVAWNLEQQSDEAIVGQALAALDRMY